MKKKTINFLLSAFQIIIDFSILIFILIIMIIGLMAIVAIIAHGSDATELFATANTGIQIAELIDGLIMSALAVTVTIGIRNIIDNINNSHYFVIQNLAALRKILWSTVILFVIQLINSDFFRLLNLKDVNKFFTFHGNDFSSSLAFIITIFLVYLVFKRGLALQREADSII